MGSERDKDDDAAAEMVWEVVRATPEVHSTQTQRAQLTTALQMDLATAENTARRDEERLVKLETHTEALTEAVLAISVQTQALTEAVLAVSDAAAVMTPAIAALKSDT
jgi:hypothetical protein